MSGEDIPYQLRPNKYIDRQLFLDLLSQLVPSIGSDKYVYVSMGGKHLIDHTAIYRQLGITKLFSFDAKESIVARQNFNRPIDSAVCREMTSGKLAGALDSILASFEGSTNLIVWLDYTSPSERLSQLQELTEVTKRLQVGDVIRITLNASLASLEDPNRPTAWKDEGFTSPKKYRLDKLEKQLGKLVPVDLDGVGDDDFASVLCRCIGLAISKAAGERKDVSFIPVLSTTYKDGQRMVTVTCVVVPRNDEAHAIPRSWSLSPNAWNQVISISAPDLSVREKLRIDEHLSLDTAKIAEKLGFDLGATSDKSRKAIASYQKLHRYYPSFHHVVT